MREMLLPKRHRRLYAKIKYAEKARARESRRVQEREAAAAAAGDGSSSA